jgi:hypothetical protein
MLTGTRCPQCGQPVMAYGRFFREAEPYKTSRCSHCDVELQRKGSVWLLLGGGAVVLATLTGLAWPYLFTNLGIAGGIVVLLVVVAVWVLLLNVCGWLFVGWKQVAPKQKEE